MKRCVNPNCEAAFVFGNDRTNCPFCHSRLVSIEENGADYENIVLPDQIIFDDANIDDNGQPFIRRQRNKIECHGRIVEIEHQELFNSAWHKFFNSLFLNEPYQLAHQSVEYAVRVENISDGYATETADFNLYGNYLGRLQVGDEVNIRAKFNHNRRVVKSIYNRTTGSKLRPSLQFPSWLIKAFALIVTVLIVIAAAFLIGIAVMGVLPGLMVFLFLCVGALLFFRRGFRGRRRW